MHWLRAGRIYVTLYAIGLVAFGAVAGARLLHQSPDPHFVYQADAWLNGHLAIEPRPTKGDDWAIVESVELDDGSVVRGRRMTTRPTFLVAGGEEIDRKRIRRTVDRTYYVSFPPAPAVLMIPSALIAGRGGNDVIPTVLLAALVLPLLLGCYRRMTDVGVATRGRSDLLWLAVAFAFGTSFFYAAVQGRVWFTAHVVGVVAALAFVFNALGARRPLLAGVFLGLAALSRVPMAFLFPLFIFEAWRVYGGRWRELFRALLTFAAPVIVLAIVAMIYNYARWSDPLEFGHRFLHVRQQASIEAQGLFDLTYFGRNARAAFALVPELRSTAPYVLISGHGLAVWLTTPIILWAFVRRNTSRFHVSLLVVVAIVAIPTLLYQNTGWVQFGYRFALDYLALIFLLIAASRRPLGRAAKAAIVLGIAINLFGAVTFGRYYKYYKTDAATFSALDRS